MCTMRLNQFRTSGQAAFLHQPVFKPPLFNAPGDPIWPEGRGKEGGSGAETGSWRVFQRLVWQKNQEGGAGARGAHGGE